LPTVQMCASYSSAACPLSLSIMCGLHCSHTTRVSDLELNYMMYGGRKPESALLLVLSNFALKPVELCGELKHLCCQLVVLSHQDLVVLSHTINSSHYLVLTLATLQVYNRTTWPQWVEL